MTRKGPNYIWRKSASVEWLEKHAERLNENTGGRYALIERPGRSRITVESFCDSAGAARELAKLFGGSVVQLPTDWAARYFESHKTKPLRIGNRLTIQSEHDPAARRSVLSIPAGAAFGTGEHATTAMSLRLLERVSRKLPSGWRMLDAGTGSGILALAARRFGGGHIVAVDNDRIAIRTARANARNNQIQGINFIAGDARDHVAGIFDVITANLYSDLLQSVLPRFRRGLGTDGRLILSGVLLSQEGQIIRALMSNSFRITEVRRRGKWVALLALPVPKT